MNESDLKIVDKLVRVAMLNPGQLSSEEVGALAMAYRYQVNQVEAYRTANKVMADRIRVMESGPDEDNELVEGRDYLMVDRLPGSWWLP